MDFECFYLPAANSRNVIVSKEYIRGLEEKVRQMENSNLQSSSIANTFSVGMHQVGIQNGPVDVKNEHIHSNGISSNLSDQQGETSSSTRHHNIHGEEVESDDAMGNIREGPTATKYFGSASNVAFIEQILNATLNENTSNILSEVIQKKPVPNPRASLHPASMYRKDVNPYQVPPQATCYHYVKLYFEYFHILFPYLHQTTYIHELETSIQKGFEGVNPLWLALLNMVMAIGSIVDPNPDISWRSKRATGMEFFERASALEVEGDISSADHVTAIHVLLLECHFLQSTDKSSKCWNVLGLAIRMARGQGLGDARMSQGLGVVESEIRRRAWWGVWVLDRLLSMTFGRAPSIVQNMQSTPGDMPLELDNESIEGFRGTNVPLIGFFICNIQLYQILGIAIECLHDNHDHNSAIRNVNRRPDEVSHKVTQIISLEQRLVQFRASVPSHLFLSSQHKPFAQDCPSIISLHATTLALRYLRVRTVIHRPLLLAGLQSVAGKADHGLWGDDGYLRNFARMSAGVCVQCAERTIQITKRASQDCNIMESLGPWWYTLYDVFNASLVLFASLFTLLSSKSSSFVESDLIRQRSSFLDAVMLIRTKLRGGDRVTADRCVRFLEKLVEATNLSSHLWDNNAIPVPVLGSDSISTSSKEYHSNQQDATAGDTSTNSPSVGRLLKKSGSPQFGSREHDNTAQEELFPTEFEEFFRSLEGNETFLSYSKPFMGQGNENRDGKTTHINGSFFDTNLAISQSDKWGWLN